MTFNEIRAYAVHTRLDSHDLDPYAAKGVALSHDAASLTLACLARDAYELRARGGDANNAEADVIDMLRANILAALR